MTDPPQHTLTPPPIHPDPQGLSMTAKVSGGRKERLAARPSLQREERGAFSISNEGRKPRVKRPDAVLIDKV